MVKQTLIAEIICKAIHDHLPRFHSKIRMTKAAKQVYIAALKMNELSQRTNTRRRRPSISNTPDSLAIRSHTS
jgi:hypothetical protein